MYILYYPLLNTASKTKWCCVSAKCHSKQQCNNELAKQQRKNKLKGFMLFTKNPINGIWSVHIVCILACTLCTLCTLCIYTWTKIHWKCWKLRYRFFSCQTNNSNLFLMMRYWWMLFGVQAFNQRSFLQYNSIDSLL